MEWETMSKDELVSHVIDTIHDLSKDGVAPTVREFKAARPKAPPHGVPDIVTIKRRTQLKWSDLVEMSGLRAPFTVREWDSERWYALTVPERMEVVCELLREMRSDRGKPPSVRYFDKNKPEWAPQARTIVSQFGKAWSEIQQSAGVDSECCDIENLANNRSIEPSTLTVSEPVEKRIYHWTRRCYVVAQVSEVL